MKKEVEQVVKSENDLTFKEIWDTLSAIDVSEYTEQKMNLTYLSWARAVMLVSNVYEMKYKFCAYYTGLPYRLLPDGSAEVITEITIIVNIKDKWLYLLWITKIILLKIHGCKTVE